MSTAEEPLHVKVARALGCKPRPHVTYRGRWACGCGDLGPAYEYTHQTDDEPWLCEYGVDWRATGPLIDRLGICLRKKSGPGGWDDVSPVWIAEENEHRSGHSAADQSPLIAVCNLILELAKEGKSPEGK